MYNLNDKVVLVDLAELLHNATYRVRFWFEAMVLRYLE